MNIFAEFPCLKVVLVLFRAVILILLVSHTISGLYLVANLARKLCCSFIISMICDRVLSSSRYNRRRTGFHFSQSFSRRLGCGISDSGEALAPPPSAWLEIREEERVTRDILIHLVKACSRFFFGCRLQAVGQTIQPCTARGDVIMRKGHVKRIHFPVEISV